MSLALAVGAVSCARGDEQGFQDILNLNGKTARAQSPADFSAVLVPTDQSGEFSLRISAKLPPDHYTYSTTQPSGAATKITMSREDGLDALTDDFEADHLPEIVDDTFSGALEKYYKKVTWSRNYRLKAGVAPESISVAGLVVYQVCDKLSCRPNLKYAFDVKLTASGASAAKPGAPPRLQGTSSSPVRAASNADPSTRFQQMVGSRDAPTLGSTWTVSLQPMQARAGEVVTVTVQADLEPGWHVYALDQRQLPNGEGPSPTVIGVTELGGLVPVNRWFTGPKPSESPSEWKGLNQRYHEGQVQWVGKFRVPDDAAEHDISLNGKVAWQLCNSGGCQLATGFEFAGKLIVADEQIADAVPFIVTARLRVPEAGAAIDELRVDLTNASPVVEGANANGSVSAGPARGTAAHGAAPENAPGEGPTAFEVGNNPNGNANVIDRSQGLPLFLVAAVLAGFGALLTPCVFPMIPITVSFFQKQSEKQHHRPIAMATVYCLGIMGTFTGLGMIMSIVFSAAAISQLASNWVVNLFIAGVLVFFAFNLLGMFEIQMPSWLLTYTAGKESKGGFIGVLFMALTFTLTSFTCTFAFAGALLAAAAHGDRLWPTLGLLAFSAAFSLPFFFLALFPSLLQKLPRSGGWMNIVKVIMGLIELGAAFKFVGNVDTTWNGQPAIFDFHAMISAWAVISICAALYLMGLFRLPHDTPRDHIGVVPLMFAMSFLGFASYLAVGLFAADKPHGMVWRYVEAFANPNFESGSDPSGPWLKHGDLKYALDFERAMDVAIAENKPLFLDFTGVTCTNCRYMEKGPMSQPDIEQKLKRFVRIQLFTDSVPIADKTEGNRLRDFNLRLQDEWFRDTTLPAYVVIPPDRSVLKDPSRIIQALKGKHEDAEFSQFLDNGWKGWQKVLAKSGGRVVGQR